MPDASHSRTMIGFDTMPAKSPSSLYDVLGLNPGASAQDVRQAWRRLAQQHHPDRSEASDSEAMALINQAYEVLSDADRRARYDSGRVRSAEPRRPGRVKLPADRTKARLAWAAAGTLVAASAAWALVKLLDEPAAAPPAPAATAGAAGADTQPGPVSPPPDAEQAADPPLRLIPADRIEARPPAPAAEPTATAQGATPGSRLP